MSGPSSSSSAAAAVQAANRCHAARETCAGDARCAIAAYLDSRASVSAS